METGKDPSPLSRSREAAIRRQLDSILADPTFSGANRRSRLLRYLVEKVLENSPESIKESVIAVEVFDRVPGYNPQIDSVVRVEVGRLRARLAEYYAKADPQEPVLIEIPKGGYCPTFVFRDSAPPARTVEPKRQIRKWSTAAAVMAGVTIAAVLTASAFWRTHATPPIAPPSIAVLPFLNLSADAADEYLGDGISEELTETLAEFSDLRVVARTSAFQYKGKGADVREIGRDLRAEALLEGSVTRREGKLHVIAQLIRTSDGFHLWSRSYEATLADLPPVEAAIARAARDELAPRSPIAAGETAALRDPEAHDLYIRAAYELNRRTAASTRQAIALAGQAAQKDSSFAQPYVLMAAGEGQLNTMLAQPPHAGAERAWTDISKALALDPANSGAHAQKALLAYTDRWDWPQAEREFREALASGSHGSAESLYGWCLMTRGRFDEARWHLQMAAELDPLSLGPQLNQVEELIDERNYPAARGKAEAILQTAPTNGVALVLAASTAFWQRDCSAAAGWNQRLWALLPKAFSARLNSTNAYDLCEHPALAKTVADNFAQNPLPGFSSPYQLAAAYALSADADRALSYLEKSAELREPTLLEIKVDRAFDFMRQDPRFTALERKIGLLD